MPLRRQRGEKRAAKTQPVVAPEDRLIEKLAQVPLGHPGVTHPLILEDRHKRRCFSQGVARIESLIVDIKARVALTGRPGVGKTTLIERVVARLDTEVGGMVTKEILRCGRRVGFAVIDLASGEQGVLAHIHRPSGPRIGSYRVNLDDLERIGMAAVERSLERGGLTVIDEVAPMEMQSARFISLLERALASDVSLLISTHARLQHPIVHRVRRELSLVRVRLGNRDELVDTVVSRFTERAARPKA